MKTFTPFLIKFAVLASLLTIAFRFFLSYGIENKSKAIIAISAITYAFLMFTFGWIFGKKDGEYLPIFDVGFRFHLTTYIICNSISYIWFILKLNAPLENIDTIHKTALIWGVLLLVHFIFYLWAKKNSIEGLDKKDLFD